MVPGYSLFLSCSNIQRSPFQIQTALRTKKLFFNYIQSNDGRRSLYVEGGGVNATITQADVGATNGVIHMIDRILGYADQNIFEKLQTDPMLQYEIKMLKYNRFHFIQQNFPFHVFFYFISQNDIPTFLPRRLQ